MEQVFFLPTSKGEKRRGEIKKWSVNEKEFTL
jgi:hypothetical protein